MRRAPVVLLAAASLVAACTGDRRPAPSGDPDAAHRHRLAAAAARVVASRFDATYRFAERVGGRTGTIRIRQTPAPRRYRVDITVARTVSYFALDEGLVACSERDAGRGWSCFLVARPGEPIPESFDPGVHRLFEDAVRELGQRPADYVVRLVTPSAAPSAAAPAGAVECFAVERRPAPDPPPSGGSPPPGFESGEYCFAASGVPTRFSVATGSLELVELHAPPSDAAFRPPAEPVRLPSLDPAASPSR